METTPFSKRLGPRKRLALEIFRQIRKNETKTHELYTLFWECTLRCNVACRHCGSDCRVSSRIKDMPAKDFLRVIDEEVLPHVDPHRVLVIFTGGEALLREDLPLVGKELNRREFPWGVVSNGYLMDERMVATLVGAGMHTATISLDGFEETHNWMRRNPRSFERASRAIHCLGKQEGVKWDVVTCVTPRLFDDLPRFRDFLVGLGVRRWRLFTIFPVGRAAWDGELQLSDAQFTQLLRFIRDIRREGRIQASYGCEGFLGNYEMEVRDHFYACEAGIHVASILADGSISGCPSIRANFHQGNIYQDAFWEVWEKRFAPYRDRSWARQGACADCSFFRYCEGNGMHLRDEEGRLLVCHHKRLVDGPLV